MNLMEILSNVNQIEKIPFLKILDGFCAESRKRTPQIDEILTQSANQLKNVDDKNIAMLFDILNEKYSRHLDEKIKFSDYQLDVIVEIFVADGNQMMSREWFHSLYNQAIRDLRSVSKSLTVKLNSESGDLPAHRKRDYSIYQRCVKTAYDNDLIINREQQLSWEEKTILHTLSRSLDLSNEEIRNITYSVLPLQKHDIDDVIAKLKEAGIIFFSRKSNTLFVPDEIVRLLRNILNIELANKYLRRILRHLRDAEINLISRKHNIDRKLSRDEKIREILKQGVNVTSLLSTSIFADKVSKADRSKRVQELIINLEIDLPKSGRSLEEKVANMITYFDGLEKDDTKSLSRDGFAKLLTQLRECIPSINDRIKADFQIQNEDVMSSIFLSQYGIGPRDILYLLQKNELVDFCKRNGIKSRGNLVANIIDEYRNIHDLYLENYEAIGSRDLKALKENGLTVKESDLGNLYEELTRDIFRKLGFNVDEKLRKEINTLKNKLDILLNLGGKDVIIIECKSVKDKNYNKYTAVSRQLKAYENLCKKNLFRVSQVLIVSNDFTEDFISECEYDYELSLSLITSQGLVNVLNGLKESSLTELPVRLLLKDGLLNSDRIVKVLNR